MGIEKRSITLFSHRTSMSLEEEFWNTLQDIAIERSLSIQKLIEEIDEDRSHKNLSSAIRVYILKYYQNKIK